MSTETPKYQRLIIDIKFNNIENVGLILHLTIHYAILRLKLKVKPEDSNIFRNVYLLVQINYNNHQFSCTVATYG